MNDVCLISAVVGERVGDNVFSGRNLGLALLASNLRKNNFSCKIINAISLINDLESLYCEINKHEYNCFGISILGNKCWSNAKKIIKKIRQEGGKQKIILGGWFASFQYNRILNDPIGKLIDCICLGEGEYTMVDFYSCIKEGRDWQNLPGIAYKSQKGVVVNPIKENVDLNLLPFAAMDEYDEYDGSIHYFKVISSRGCYGNCKYCSVRSFYGIKTKRWRAKSVEHTVSEIEHLLKEYGIRKFSFVDDNFVGPGESGKERAIKICDNIADKNLNIDFAIECRPDDMTERLAQSLSKAGCRLVFLGVESGSNEQLKQLGKGKVNKSIIKKAILQLVKNNVRVYPGFMMFTPNNSVDDLLENVEIIRFFLKENIHNGFPIMSTRFLPLSFLEPLKGSAIHEQLTKEKRLIDKRFSNYSYYNTNTDTELIKRIYLESNLHELIEEIEVNTPELAFDNVDNDKAIAIGNYDTERTTLTLDFLVEIIHCVKDDDLSEVVSKTELYKRKYLSLVMRHIKHIKKLLHRNEIVEY